MSTVRMLNKGVLAIAIPAWAIAILSGIAAIFPNAGTEEADYFFVFGTVAIFAFMAFAILTLAEVIGYFVTRSKEASYE